MDDDIVRLLRELMAYGTFPDESVYGRAVLAAADEIERLRSQVEFAHSILGSTTMVWLFHGSEGWQQSNIDHLRDPIHEYWEKYGNALKEARRG